MKSILFLLIASITSLTAYAEDIFFQIDRFNMTGTEGTFISREFLIKSSGGDIGFKSDVNPFKASITIKDKVMTIQGSNGTYIKTEAPFDIKSIPETNLLNGILIRQEEKISLKADNLQTGASGFKFFANNLNILCEINVCRANASLLTVDYSMHISNPNFSCAQDACSENFAFVLAAIAQTNFKSTSLEMSDKSVIELKDLTNVVIRRINKSLTISGNVDLPLFGIEPFIIKADIVQLTDKKLVLNVRNVTVS